MDFNEFLKTAFNEELFNEDGEMKKPAFTPAFQENKVTGLSVMDSSEHVFDDDEFFDCADIDPLSEPISGKDIVRRGIDERTYVTHKDFEPDERVFYSLAKPFMDSSDDLIFLSDFPLKDKTVVEKVEVRVPVAANCVERHVPVQFEPLTLNLEGSEAHLYQDESGLWLFDGKDYREISGYRIIKA